MKQIFCVVACLSALCLVKPSFAEDGQQYRTVMERAVSSMVTVKAVLKTSMKFGGQGRDTESRLEAQGLVVAADGLVMFSNLPLNPEKLMGQDGGGGEDGGQRFGMKITPTSFKVTFGREEKEYPAYLVATDSKLDLAFVKIEDLGGRKVLPIAFDTSSTVLIGQEVLYITRLSKGYDYAPFFATLHIAGEIRKPRKAWVLDLGIAEPAMPIYTRSGKIIGVVALVESSVRDESGDGGFSSRGGGNQAFVVPSTVVQGVLDQAKIRAASAFLKRKSEKKTGRGTPPENK
ncbi:MAG: hypothetical protein NT023_20090 [Armatimonadetes bacterium]|nr:hypothetical protein [Armatimonadota bacterium]